MIKDLSEKTNSLQDQVKEIEVTDIGYVLAASIIIFQML